MFGLSRERFEDETTPTKRAGELSQTLPGGVVEERLG